MSSSSDFSFTYNFVKVKLKMQTFKNTMKPVYSGHLRDRPNVSAIDNCPLFRGLTKSLLKPEYHAQQSFDSYSEGYKGLFFIDRNIIVLIFLYLYLISILVKKRRQRAYALEKKIKTNTFIRWLIFLFQYFCLGLHSYKQKTLLEKKSVIFFCF